MAALRTRVLLIEDNPADARLLAAMLDEARREGHPFDLLWVDTLARGLAHVRGGEVDVVLLDLGLPRSCGLQTLQQLMRGARGVPPVVVMSGLADEDMALQALRDGAQDYLIKGQADAAALVRAIHFAISRAQTEHAVREPQPCPCSPSRASHPRDEVETLVLERTAELRAAKDRAEQANKIKTGFLASMSHELRGPLGGILGFAQLLQLDATLGSRQRESVDAIRKSGEHLLALICDLLDLAKVEAGKFELHPSTFALSELVDMVTDVIRIKVNQKQPAVVFSWTVAPELPQALRADITRLRQVLLNLLDNSVKFTERGRITLRLDLVRPGRLRAQVEDTGCGMTEEQTARLFKPFEQVGTLHQRCQGAGLGLAISRQLVRLMGGDIQVVSHPGIGNLFWFEVDFEEAR